MELELIAITAQGEPERAIANLSETAVQVMKSTAAMYCATRFQPPWVGYLAVAAGACVGTCAFKAPPQNNEVEIAYFTFPEHEGQGLATQMAAQLIAIARAHVPAVVIVAQTLPEDNASTRILSKLGFARTGVIDHPQDGTVWEWKLPVRAGE